MKSNYIATLYFIVGFLTSFSLMVQGEQLYVNLAGLTLFLYLLFSLTEALEDLVYTIKNSALKLLTIICSFFLPISGILGLLFALILADTATGIWKAKHLKHEITSRKLSAIISKLLLYELCVILFFLIDYFILNDIILVFFSVPLMLTKVLALVLASIEIMSVSENWRIVKGVNLFQSAKLLFTRAIDIKNDINKLK
jgi:hypothetical protein